MKKLACACVGLMGSVASLFAADWWTLENGVLTVNNDNADISASTNDYTAVIGADVTKIVKTGPGAVRLSGANASFKGEIEVQAGLLMGWVQESYSGGKTLDNYGAPTKITVSNGATFEMLATPIENVAYTSSRFANTQVYAEGNGVNGMGALYRRGSLQIAERSYATIKHLTLNGPTLIGVGMRWGFNGNCTLNQNGHTLTLKAFSKNNNTFNFSRGGKLVITNPGDVILDGVTLCNENTYPPTAASGQTLAESTLVITNGAACQLLVDNKTTIGSFVIPYQILSYGGEITGPNAGQAAYDEMGTLSGDVTLASGTMTLRAYAASGYARLAFTGHINGRGTLSTYQYGGNTGNANKLTSVTLLGGGKGERNEFGRINVQGGRFELTGGAFYSITNGGAVAGYAHDDKFLARLIVTNATLSMNTSLEALVKDSGYNSPCNLLVAEASSKFGVVDLGQGAVVTNDMGFGRSSGGAGALYLHDDANLYWHGGGTSNPFLGSAGYAFMGLRDNATIGNLGYFNVGSSGGRSFVIQRGGTYHNAPCAVKGHKCGSTYHTTAFKIGRTNGEAHYYQCGGTQWSKGNVWFTWDYATNVYNSRGSFTADGTADSEVNDINFCVTVNGTPDYRPTVLGTFGHVNVNGGTLKVNRIYKTFQSGFKLNGATKNATWNDVKNICPNTWGFVNFNGGTLKVKGNGDFFSANGTAEDARLPTRVTVYEKGATIDTDVDSTWRLPLEKPYGLGIKSIALTDDIRKDLTYIGPGWIKFAGDGSNTTAIVDFDETIRTNRGVIVTGQGFAWTAKPTVTIEKSACNNTFWTIPAENVEMVDFDSADYAAGGVTKKGTGTLTLAGLNTYGGATRIENGTLAFTLENGYPGGDLEFTGKSLAESAPKAKMPTLSFKTGCGLRIADADLLDRETFGKRKTVLETTTAITALPSVAFVSTNGTTISTANGWKRWSFRIANGGKALTFGPERGLILTVR